MKKYLDVFHIFAILCKYYLEARIDSSISQLSVTVSVCVEHFKEIVLHLPKLVLAAAFSSDFPAGKF